MIVAAIGNVKGPPVGTYAATIGEDGRAANMLGERGSYSFGGV